MKKAAVDFYRQGYNCSQCILKAAERVYKIPVSNKVIAMCEGISSGFGIGSFCSVLIAGIMVFGAMYDEETVKRLRIKLLSEFDNDHGSLNCSKLKSVRTDNLCEPLVAEIAGRIEKIISDENKGIFVI